MNTGRDEDALRWDGDDDPTLDVGTRAAAREAGAGSNRAVDPAAADDPAAEADDPAQPLALPDGFQAVGKDSAKVGHIEKDGTVVMPGDTAPTMMNGHGTSTTRPAMSHTIRTQLFDPRVSTYAVTNQSAGAATASHSATW